MNSICVFLAVCCQHGMTIQQYDVDTTFINGVLKKRCVHSQALRCRTATKLSFETKAKFVWTYTSCCNMVKKTISSVFNEHGVVACVSDPCIIASQDDNLSRFLT